MKPLTSFLATAWLPLAALAQSGTWSCSVPEGYTYDQVVKVTSTCGPGANPYYHILTPTDNLWACLQVIGHVYDEVQSSTACSLTGAPAIQYHLRTPVDGLMSCGPGTYNGFVWDFTVPTTLCTLSGEAQMYHIRAPVDNLWSCAQIAGFVYDQVELSSECALGPLGTGAQATLYHLRKPVDGLWGCGDGSYNGFTYDQIVGTSSCEVGTSSAPSYHLRKPVAGLWACSVPSGFSYAETKVVGNCELGSEATEYLLE